MDNSSFKIYNASAGSGKTYTLSSAYLKIILSRPFSFKRILAITFTNKAVNEMKGRILQSLFNFSKVTANEKASPLFLEIMDALELSVPELQKLSELRLKEILHNYAFFDISTIDKFTHRLIRTFARDLKIPQNFEVVLDTDLLLDEAVARILSKAGEDKELTKVLLNFALEKIDDDRSWDIGYDLLKIGKLLFNENNITHLASLKDKDLLSFKVLKEKIIGQLQSLEKELSTMATETLKYIEGSGLEMGDFPYQTLPNHFKKIKDGVLSPSILYKNKLEENLISGKIVKANVVLPSIEIPIRLLQQYLDLKTLIYKRSFAHNVYRNLVPLTLLNAIQQEVVAIQKEKDQLSISEFNSIISNEIKNQPAPFIYERLGEKYRHYFIDEFQDTSEMQWTNLIPLIGSSLEGEDDFGKTGFLFLVGDVKQAIYRWRGGKAEQFLDLATGQTSPFSVAADTHLLPKNYRSHKEIINFNNGFFQSASQFLENDKYKHFFKEGNKQETNAKKGGYVKLSFLEEDTNENYGQKTLEAINQALSNGYDLEDICIIIRKKKHGVYLADYLMKEHIPVISSESLLLSASPKIQFLVNLIRWSLQPEELVFSYSILHFLSKKSEHKHDFIFEHIHGLAAGLQNEFNFNSDLFSQLSVYDGMEYAIRIFNLSQSQDAYLNAFMDTVFEIEQKDGADKQSFLNYWDKKEDKISIVIPESTAAVQIMTIHKAKGLEFPVVIYPYANTNIYEEIDPKLWIPMDSDAYSGFSEVLITKKQEVLDYGNTEAQIFNDEQGKLQLDSFNLLYVALTRAVCAMYIISAQDFKKNQTYKTDYFSGLFIHFLKEQQLWNGETFNYEFGVAPKKEENLSKENYTTTIPYIYTHKDRPSFSILTRAGMLWDTEQEKAIKKGNTIHYLLGLIKFAEDLETALKIGVQKGIIIARESEQIKSTLLQVLLHKDLKALFEPGITVLNETDILIADGTIQRPDRVVIKNKEVYIIDYKTGGKNPKYKNQLNTYAATFLDMNYVVAHKIIVYINDNIEVEFIP
ncbi:UvrD-helicase domain-containing protein [Maribacter sp. R77961]|uniref:UvrD-helicase domain-containing protein n=1 Tax=Maribacter sp. R77961 TaxID=3093871 RepID=UPI0037CBCB93